MRTSLPGPHLAILPLGSAKAVQSKAIHPPAGATALARGRAAADTAAP